MFAEKQKCFTFASESYMVVVAQLVRASVCGTEGRRFEPGLPPKIKGLFFRPFFVGKCESWKTEDGSLKTESNSPLERG